MDDRARIVRPLGLLLVGLIAFAAQASKPPVPAWPPAPADPCIVYVRSISRPADIGAKAGSMSRLANWLTGAPTDSKDLVKPFGLSVDAEGGVLVTDTGANAVLYLEPARKTWLRWESAGKTRFECPVAAARHLKTFFVADSVLGKVLAIDEKGALEFEVTRELERPAGVVVSGDKLFVADSQLHQVLVYDLRGNYLSKFGKRGAGAGEFNFPTHVAADAAGQIYVTDSLNCRVQVFDSQGRHQQTIGSAGDGPGHFSRPKGVAVDHSGHIYVIDAVFDNVQTFDNQGRLLLNWGESGSAPGEFWLPNAVAIDRQNQIYVADSYNHRIQVFQYTGKQ